MNKTAQTTTAQGQGTAPSALKDMVQGVKIPRRLQMSLDEVFAAHEAITENGFFEGIAAIYALGYSRGTNSRTAQAADSCPLMFETPIPEGYAMTLDEIASFFQNAPGGLYWNCLSLYRMAFMGGYSYGWTKATALELIEE
jgi:hypothetical protein